MSKEEKIVPTEEKNLSLEEKNRPLQERNLLLEERDLPLERFFLLGAGSAEAPMEKEAFEELIESVRGGGRILRGESEPSREFTFGPEDVQAGR